MTLTDFLLARIAEDEAAAARAGSFTPWSETFQNDNYGHLTIQPSRIERECEAKRRIVEEHSLRVDLYESDHCAVCVYDNGALDVWPCPTLRILAAVYADHPDYRDEWKS